ncbi:hypothetical protein B0H12DRAFT_1246759 [Mycena haematopus]|nr:hypothetical protein B0H12DRAFT_1246759 [Mycena haematopus]
MIPDVRQSPPPLPAPARLLGSLRGKHPPQLHSSHVLKKPDTKGLLVAVWRADDVDPAITFLPCVKGSFIRLNDHKETLEAVYLHPTIAIEQYVPGKRSKDGTWRKLSWSTYLSVPTSRRLLLCWKGVGEDVEMLRKWEEYAI